MVSAGELISKIILGQTVNTDKFLDLNLKILPHKEEFAELIFIW